MRRRRLLSEINVVPYIDVMLVLLVIFMAAAPLLTQGIPVRLPDVDAEPVPQSALESPLQITVRADGALFVNLGQEGAGEAISLPALEAQVARIARARPDVPVFLRGDAKAEYGRVTQVFALLQQAGLTDVGLITEPAAADPAAAGEP